MSEEFVTESEIVELCAVQVPGWRVAFYNESGVAIKVVACWGRERVDRWWNQSEKDSGKDPQSSWFLVAPLVEQYGELVSASDHHLHCKSDGYIVLPPGVEWEWDMPERDDACIWIDAPEDNA
jgi:hypothetical protein